MKALVHWREAANVVCSLGNIFDPDQSEAELIPRSALKRVLQIRLPPKPPLYFPEDILRLDQDFLPIAEHLKGGGGAKNISIERAGVHFEIPPTEYGYEYDAQVLLRTIALAICCFKQDPVQVYRVTRYGHANEIARFVLETVLHTIANEPSRLKCLKSAKPKTGDRRKRPRIEAIVEVHTYKETHNVSFNRAREECEVHPNTWNAYLKNPTADELLIKFPHPKLQM